MLKATLILALSFWLKSCYRGEPGALSEFHLPAAPTSDARLNGSKFIAEIENLSIEQRELQTELQITAGNFPDFLRHFVPVFIDARDARGSEHRLLIFVMPDYLAIGTNSDFVRIPMRPATAQRIADSLALLLPTPKIVDEIYKNTQVMVHPTSMRPSSMMTSPQYFKEHNALIEDQLGTTRRGMLVSGGKKDIVITSKLNTFPDRVAIYGWHRPDGTPVQRLNLEHANTYADYSHGARMISRHAILDGEGVDLAELMNDPVLSAIVSNDGVVAANVYDRRHSRVGLAH